MFKDKKVPAGEHPLDPILDKLLADLNAGMPENQAKREAFEAYRVRNREKKNCG